MGHPWDRLAGESDPAHAAFVVYRDLGPGRSLTAVARELKGGSAGDREGIEIRVPSRLRGWCARHRWVDRAVAWDDHLRRARDAVVVREHTKWAERWHEEVERLYEISERALGEIDRLFDKPERSYADVRAIAQLVDVTLKVKAVVRDCIHIDAARITDDQLRAIAVVLAPTPTGVLPPDAWPPSVRPGVRDVS